ncbi:hypothetical protein NMY22_g4713 [Coprinellus aureogranulatus]|nr:hypothetical protein NMY22_g4713 [Coprinellus aureogranulatus]
MAGVLIPTQTGKANPRRRPSVFSWNRGSCVYHSRYTSGGAAPGVDSDSLRHLLLGDPAPRIVEDSQSLFHFEHAHVHVLVCTCLPGMASDAFRFAELAVNSGDKIQSVDEVWLTPFICARATDSPSVKRGLVYALRIPSHYDRGPQSAFQSRLYEEQDFLNQCFHRWYSKLLDTSRDFTAADADWWLSAKEQTSQDCREMFVHVHAKVPTVFRILRGSTLFMEHAPVCTVVPLSSCMQGLEKRYTSSLQSEVMVVPRSSHCFATDFTITILRPSRTRTISPRSGIARSMEGAHRQDGIIVQEAHIRNVAGEYHDYSTNVGNYVNIVASPSTTSALDRLLERVAPGALHDSAERGADAPKCHPETRTAVQKEIMSWIKHGEQDGSPKKILWLSGPAGSGKTAIAGTIADECYREGLLAASFFFSAFSGSQDRRSMHSLLPTLVYRLLEHNTIHGFKHEVLSVLERDPMVFDRNLEQQLEHLILRPLRNIFSLSNVQKWQWPKVIVIDGLDECEGDHRIRPERHSRNSKALAHKEILVSLRACSDPAFPFYILLASRPEPATQHFFDTFPNPVHHIFLDEKSVQPRCRFWH